MIALGRFVAVVVGVATFVFLFIRDHWDAGNLFLVPDLILSAGLVMAAVVPRPWARPALLLGHGFATGVLTTSVSSYAVRGELGAASLAGAVACAIVGVLVFRGERAAPSS